MRIYLAGPMRGYKNFNFDTFNAAANKLRSEYPSVEVFNPAERDINTYGDIFYSEKGDLDDIPPWYNHRETLKADTTAICDSDCIMMLPGWEKSTGARAEHALAVALGIKIGYFREEDLL